jgi:hypothetical protein
VIAAEHARRAIADADAKLALSRAAHDAFHRPARADGGGGAEPAALKPLRSGGADRRATSASKSRTTTTPHRAASSRTGAHSYR